MPFYGVTGHPSLTPLLEHFLERRSGRSLTDGCSGYPSVSQRGWQSSSKQKSPGQTIRSSLTAWKMGAVYFLTSPDQRGGYLVKKMGPSFRLGPGSSQRCKKPFSPFVHTSVYRQDLPNMFRTNNPDFQLLDACVPHL